MQHLHQAVLGWFHYSSIHHDNEFFIRYIPHLVFCLLHHLLSGAYLWKIAPMASTKIAFYIYYLLIISPGIHVYVYYMVFAKLLQENYLKNLF